MKQLFLSTAVYFCLFMPIVHAQFKVTEQSGKKPDWTMSVEYGWIIGIGNGPTIEIAKDDALVNVKAQIVSSVADFISASSTSKSEEITADKFSQFYQSYSDVVTTQSGKRDYLQGVSAAKVEDYYWEKSTDKKSKEVRCQYFIKYPFTKFDLDELIADFREKDAQLTSEMNKALSLLDDFTSIEEIQQSQSQLSKLMTIFIDERKAKCETGIEKSKALLASAYIADAGSELGMVRYSLKIGNKAVSCSKKPTINANCARIGDRKLGEVVCEVAYLYDECYDEPGNSIKIVYSFSNTKAEKEFYFDVAENKAELVISGNIRIDGGKINGDMVSGATCVIPLKSKFDSPVEVSKIILEWPESSIMVEMPINEIYKGKGQHELRFEIPKDLPISKISTATNPHVKVNGTIMYNSVNTGKSSVIRIYKNDYITGW
jgi:hypothetical protein